jgi:deoxyadenosine/deoxycytidine kinase
MERSHLDDIIFARHLLSIGFIDSDEYGAYERVWSSLLGRAPEPDAVICLAVEPAETVRRITFDEQAGIRPREFPNEERKVEWLTAWTEQYRRRFEELSDDPHWRDRVRVFTQLDGHEEIHTFVNECLHRGREWSK